MSTRSMARPLGAVTLIVAGALVLGACSSSHAKKKAVATTTSTTAPAVCPLTGAPSPLGTPPNRPALAVKVDNYQAARPQSGLDDTDLVFEEPVEGGITRYVAVFQCNNATSIGPVRSARNIDIGILGQLGERCRARQHLTQLVNAHLVTSRDLGHHLLNGDVDRCNGGFEHIKLASSNRREERGTLHCLVSRHRIEPTRRNTAH